MWQNTMLQFLWKPTELFTELLYSAKCQQQHCSPKRRENSLKNKLIILHFNDGSVNFTQTIQKERPLEGSKSNLLKENKMPATLNYCS